MEIIICGLLILGTVFFLQIYYKVKEKRARNKMAEMQRKATEQLKEREHAEYERKRQNEIRLRNETKQKIEQFHTTTFPVTATNEDLRAKWQVWHSSCHDENSQLIRQERALYNVIPVLIDTTADAGYFLSSDRSRIYETYLFACSCPDFEKRNLPCKHIYRLFYDLNHPEHIPDGISNVSTDICESFLKMSSSARLHFVNHAVFLPENGRVSNIDNFLRTLIKAKYVHKDFPDIDSYTPLINSKTKDQILEALKTHDIEGARQSWTKERLINWIKSEHPDFLKKYFIDYALITLSPDVIPWAKGIESSMKQHHIIPPGETYWV